jgi:putative transposase
MRYPASEKLEIIRIVEQSHLPAKKTLDQLGIARRTFYRWYDRYVEGGPEALEDRPSRPSRVWNRIGAEVQSQIIDMALEHSELSPRELAVRFTDEKRYFVSEATVYRLLKAHDLITSPAFVVIKAADEFRDKTTRPNEMWQTDFTYFKIIGWGWVYLSTVLDDFSRYIIAWKLCTTMRAEDVTDTLELALTASGCDSARVLHKPKLLSDNGPSYIASELAEWIDANGMSHVRGAPLHPQTQGKIERWHQTQEPHPAGEPLPAGRSRTPDRSLHRALQSPTPPREPWQRHAGRRLLRQSLCHHRTTRKDQTTDNRTPALAAPKTRRIKSTKGRGRNSAKSPCPLRQMS